MLGFGKNRDASLDGAVAPLQGALPEGSASAIADLLAAIGDAETLGGLSLVPVTDVALRVEGLPRADVVVHVVVERDPVRIVAHMVWLGEIVDEPLEVQLAANEWNATFAWPRAQVVELPGAFRLSGFSALYASAGWTVPQLVHWVRFAAGGAVALADFAASIWPAASLVSADSVVPVGDVSVPADGSRIEDVAGLPSRVNDVCVIGADDPVVGVSAELIASTLLQGEDVYDAIVDSADASRQVVFDWNGDEVTVAVDAVALSAEVHVPVVDPSEELLARLLREATVRNDASDGSAISLVNVGEDEPEWVVRSLCHVSVSGGLTFAQLERYTLGNALLAREGLADFVQRTDLR